MGRGAGRSDLDPLTAGRRLDMLTRTLPALLAALLLVPATAARGADVLPRAPRPEDVGLSSDRLARLTAITRDHAEAGDLPGAVILIARHGKVAYFESFGYRDRDQKLPMTPDAIFRIYSMTKPITSTAVMMLHEEGRFQITDPVSRYLPELGKRKVAVERADPATGQPGVVLVDASREITVQDLL